MSDTPERAASSEDSILAGVRYADYRMLEQSYRLFIDFVRHELAPHMELQLVEEDFYPTLWKRWHDNQFTIDEIARGHGKTEWGIWNTLWNVLRQPFNVWWDGYGPKRIMQQLIVSSGMGEAKEIGDRIEEYVFASPMFRKLVPRGADKNRTSNSWNSKKKTFTNGSVLHFRQVKCRRGLHVDGIWMDDLITESSTLSDKETVKFVQSAILPMGTMKRAWIRITGTPLRATDIIHVMSSTNQYEHQRLPAIVDWEKRQLVSKRITWDALMKVRSQMHPAKFEAEYMLNALQNNTGIVRREWIEKGLDKSLDFLNIRAVKEQEQRLEAARQKFTSWREKYYAIYGGVDYAFSDIETADWSVYATIGDRGADYDGPRFDILDVQRFKGMSLGKQLQFMLDWWNLWEHDIIGAEANSIRGSVKDIKELPMPVKLFWTGTIDERDKKRDAGEFHGRVYSVSKRNFALRQGIAYEQGNIRIPYQTERARQIADRLLLETLSWALEDNKLVEVGEHPDIPIALGYAIETALGHNFAMG